MNQVSMKDFILKRLEGTLTRSTEIDEWDILTLKNNPRNRFQLAAFKDEWRPFGNSNRGEQLFLSNAHKVLIVYPPREEAKTGDVIVAIREDNLRPCFINDISDDNDVDESRERAKLQYGYIWQSVENNPVVMLRLRKVMEGFRDDARFRAYEGCNKSWHFIDSTMLNKVDLVPQIRDVFKPYEVAEMEHGMIVHFPSGFISFDFEKRFTLAISHQAAIADGLLEEIRSFLDEGSEDEGSHLMQRLLTEHAIPTEGYLALDGELGKHKFENALLSAIGHSI